MAEETFAERLWAEIGEELEEEYDLPQQMLDNLKEDIEASFNVFPNYRPAYEPKGNLASVTTNSWKLIRHPVETAKDFVKSVVDVREVALPPISRMFRDSERRGWERVFGHWVDPVTGNPYFSPVLQEAVYRWAEVSDNRVVRLIRERALIQGNPALIKGMAERLQGVGVTHVNGVSLASIRADAARFEWAISERLRRANAAEAAGNLGLAESLRDEAENIQRGRYKDRVSGEDREAWIDPTTGAVHITPAGAAAPAGARRWDATASYANREQVIKEFEKQMRLNPALANTPEGQFYLYWKKRNLRYTTLNLLNAYRKDGASGVIRTYVWLKYFRAEGKLFGKRGLLEKWYPAYWANKLSTKLFANRLRGLATRATNARASLVRLARRYVRKPLKKVLRFVGKPVRRLFAKLGLKALGASLGSIIPGAGTAVGAVIGAAIEFLGQIIAEKIGEQVMGALKYVLACGCFCLSLPIFMALLTLVFVVGSIYAPGSGWGRGGGGPGSAVGITVPRNLTIDKLICFEETPGQFVNCHDSRRIANISPGGTVRALWRVVLANEGTVQENVEVTDTICGGTWSGSIAPGDSVQPAALTCTTAYTDADNEQTFVNTAQGNVVGAAGSYSIADIATLVIGDPGDAPPCGYPVGVSMRTTSAFMATDVCRQYDLWCGTAPMAGCSAGGTAGVTGIHSGLDLNSRFNGDPLLSTINGTIEYTHGGGGGDWCYITVCNDSWCILYGHTLCNFPLPAGTTVEVGTPIAWLDNTGASTGAHVHYMVWDAASGVTTWGGFSACAPNCCDSVLYNPAAFLGPCD
jgi:hypothetical protein